MAILNGKERSRGSWQQLIERMGSGLKVVRIMTEAHSAFGIIELALDGQDKKP